MRRFLLVVILGLLSAAAAFGQTTVNLTVQDTPDNQLWTNGTWSVQLQPAAGNLSQTRTFTLLSGGGILSNQNGSLSGAATASISLPANANIGPASAWQFTVCPQASAACFQQNVTVSTSSPQTLNINPPSIRINLAVATPPVSAYSTGEVNGATLGSSFFLIGTGAQFCSAVSGNTCSTWVSGGSTSPNIKLVQSSGSFATFSSVSTFAQAYPFPNTSGNLGVAIVNESTTGASAINSVTDTQGNTWFKAGLDDILVSTIFYCPSLKAGANTVSANLAGTSTGGISVAEYSGILAAHPVANANSPNGSNTAPTGYINSPVAGALLVLAAANNGQTSTYSNFVGVTARTPTANVAAVWGDNTSTIAGQNNYTFGQSCAAGCPDFIMKAVVFLPATYVPSVTTPTVVRQTEGAVATSGFFKNAQSSPATDLFPGGNQAGNTIVLFTEQPGTVDNITAISDSAGSTYTRLTGGGDIADNNNHRFYSVYTAPITASSFTNNTITVTLSAGTVQMGAIEVSGITGARDTSVNGIPPLTLTTGALNDFVLSVNGFSGGGSLFSNLSGTDIFNGTGSVGGNMEVNYFVSCFSSNKITANIPTGNSPASYTIALLPTNTAGCPGNSGSIALSTPSSATTLVGVATGTLSATSTLGFYQLGQYAGPAGTSTTVANGIVMNQPEYIVGFSVFTGAFGVNASSGVVSLLKNGAAFNPAITCTLGNVLSVCSDFLHPQWVVAGDVISAQVTTQALETLANLKITVYKVP